MLVLGDYDEKYFLERDPILAHYEFAQNYNKERLKNMLKKLTGIVIFSALVLSLSLPSNILASVPSKASKDKINASVSVEEGKQIVKKIISGDYEYDLSTHELVKREDRKDKKLPDGTMEPSFASGGSEHSHQYLVARAINILDNDGHNNQTDILYSEVANLLEGSDWPDFYERDPNVAGVATYAGHFYHYSKHTNYLGQTSPTAMQRMNTWMNSANSYFVDGSNNYAYALKTLGIALHYLSDMNAPHHVTNRSALTSGHVVWEDYADSNREDYTKSSGTLYNDYGTNYSSYAQASANYASGYIDEAEATLGDGSPDYTKWDLAAERTYEKCQDTLAAVIDAFFRTEGVYN
ncbi:MAG: zinc dependent phospholipase C family protein [Desulfitobacterium hafniense]|nr:zinc dependent phospholipase C family protein [Desulfitobacterium hafniense]